MDAGRPRAAQVTMPGFTAFVETRRHRVPLFRPGAVVGAPLPPELSGSNLGYVLNGGTSGILDDRALGFEAPWRPGGDFLCAPDAGG